MDNLYNVIVPRGMSHTHLVQSYKILRTITQSVQYVLLSLPFSFSRPPSISFLFSLV